MEKSVYKRIFEVVCLNATEIKSEQLHLTLNMKKQINRNFRKFSFKKHTFLNIFLKTPKFLKISLKNQKCLKISLNKQKCSKISLNKI